MKEVIKMPVFISDCKVAGRMLNVNDLRVIQIFIFNLEIETIRNSKTNIYKFYLRIGSFMLVKIFIDKQPLT